PDNRTVKDWPKTLAQKHPIQTRSKTASTSASLVATTSSSGSAALARRPAAEAWLVLM
ncbi:hypothetical protein F441_10427, partial [Phytophthora nicotianae CJ01A1]